MLNDDIIKLDRGRINARILAKEVKVDFRRVESASRKIPMRLASPEVKRLFIRFFNTLQLNAHYISVIARTQLAHEVVERVEEGLITQLEKVSAEIDEAIRGAGALCEAHGITSLASYDTEPLEMEVRVISALGRRYLELMIKVDQLMPMLETLAIDEVIRMRELDLRKALYKKAVRRVAGAARNVAAQLRKRQERLAAPPVSAQSSEQAAVPEVPAAAEQAGALSGMAESSQ